MLNASVSSSLPAHLPVPPFPQNVQIVSEITTSKQQRTQLWGKNSSVKSGNDWSFELHSALHWNEAAFQLFFY